MKEQGWKVEKRFRDWGRPLVKTGHKFTDWVLKTRKEDVEAKLEAELRDLFMKELKDGTE